MDRKQRLIKERLRNISLVLSATTAKHERLVWSILQKFTNRRCGLIRLITNYQLACTTLYAVYLEAPDEGDTQTPFL